MYNNRPGGGLYRRTVLRPDTVRGTEVSLETEKQEKGEGRKRGQTAVPYI